MTPTVPRPRHTLRLAVLLAACLALLGGAAAAFATPTATLDHGPFEIVARERRIGTGTWPNQGGNPFATRPVTDFALHWRGRPVDVPGRGNRFWQVLRLTDARHPALLLVARDFTLVSEQNGQLKVQPLASESASLAEAQWLDSDGGQPGPSMSWGLSHTDLGRPAELERRTRLQGGRWLRLGSRRVLDVQNLAAHQVEPWLPMRPGVPVTGLVRDGDEARAFSPGRTAYVLAGSQIDYARGSGRIVGLLVVDITTGTASELRVERRRMPFAHTADMDRRWIEHYFSWQRDGDGRERLLPRPGVRALPWRGALAEPARGELQYHVERMRPAFVDELRRIVLALPGAALAPDWMDPRRGIDGRTVRIGDCVLALSFHEPGLPDDDYDSRVSVFSPSAEPATRAACGGLLRRIAAATDAELSSGRHDALIVLE